MTDHFAAALTRRVWTRLLGARSWAQHGGDFRAREQYGLVPRAAYAYGLLRAADIAKYFQKKRVTVVEFGVGAGAGLLNLVDLARLVERETGVTSRIVGFDTGQGLPPPAGHKDHPELWQEGDFATGDRDTLIGKLDGRAEVMWGDIRDTIGPFIDTIDATAPLGFIAVDLDLYTSTKAALTCLTNRPEKYNPAISMCFDDVCSVFANEWAGELAAIAEFNDEHQTRKISIDRSLPGRRPVKADSWYQTMYVCHILDHHGRQRPRDRQTLTVDAHDQFMSSRFLY
jgi:hypothetical protein